MTTWGPSAPDADTGPATAADTGAMTDGAADADAVDAANHNHTEVPTEQRRVEDLPTMADLDALSAELDGVDATLAALDVRAPTANNADADADADDAPVGADVVDRGAGWSG